MVNLREISDEQLVMRAKRGDTDAFGELVARYEHRIFNLAYRMMGDPEDGADMAQEAFLRAFKALRGFRGDASFSTWLYRVASNVCLDELRRRGRRGEVSLDAPLTTEQGQLRREVPDTAAGPAEVVERREAEALVHRALGLLPDDHRLVVLLRDIEGLSYGELAEALGCPVGTVKSRLNRARAKLRELLLSAEPEASRVVKGNERGGAR